MPMSRTRTSSANARGPREDDVLIDLTSPTTSTRPDIPPPSPPHYPHQPPHHHYHHRQQQPHHHQHLHLPQQQQHQQQQPYHHHHPHEYPAVPAMQNYNNFAPLGNYSFFRSTDPSLTLRSNDDELSWIGHSPTGSTPAASGSSSWRSAGVRPRSSGRRRSGGGRGSSEGMRRSYGAGTMPDERGNARNDSDAEDTPYYTRASTPTSSPPDSSQATTSSSTGSSQEEEEQVEDTGRQSKRRRTSLPTPGGASARTRARHGDLPAAETETIDIVDTNDESTVQSLVQEQMVRAQQKGEAESQRRRIADFKCVICLDEPTELSATLCGHLFCNACIKRTLRYNQPNPANVKQGKCPVCRQKVNLKDIIPLELKLKLRSGKGKERAQA